MPERRITLKGWKAMAAGAALVGVVVFRVMTFSDKTGDAALMRQLEVQLASDYFPDQVERVRAARQGGAAGKLADVVKSVTTGKLKVKSVQTSAPLFDFSTPKDVVVKVTYTLEDSSGAMTQPKTKYYLFTYGSPLKIWDYQYESGPVRYYLNML